jgi:type VI secretion system protein ImpG
MIYRYFENEMRYLHEAAKVFAEAFPDRARYLNVDSVEDRDPYVERLFEGFAFLAGRIHERLDDDIPEITQRLVGLLYPHFLKPMPSCTIVALQPREGLVQEPMVLPRGTQVLSAPAGPERCVCTFATAHDVTLNPIRVAQAEVRYAPDETSSVRLTFEMHRGADPALAAADPLRLYLYADAPTASTMHLFLTRHVTRMEVRQPGHDQALRVRRGQEAVTPAGLGADESLLPPEPSTFSGLRLLQEYLLFRRRFWFVDVHGIGGLSSDYGDQFTVEIFFDRSYPEDRRFSRDNVRLHCAPAVNLFEHDAEPIRFEHTQSEFRVRPSNRYPTSIATYDVQEVVGIEEESGKRHNYSPYYSLGAAPVASDSGRTFTTNRRIGVTGRPEVYLALNSPELGQGRPATEIMSVSLRCTNATLPNEVLQERSITQLHPSAQQVAEPVNLDQPTLVRYPPLAEHRELLWSLLAHWSFSHQSVASRDAVTGLLALYDWANTEANKRRRKGIRNVSWQGKEQLIRGAVRRGAEVTLEVDDGAFSGEGDLCLFGLVMSHFLSQYATINAFVHLVIVTVPTGKRFSWAPDRGIRPPV